ncbi:MAG TPA: glycosyltransferase family 4 protein [Mucilaginibacter sp.]|nr:glycosyltransferase family 4 protein [Mucilaginibacter sp.]
MKRVVIVYHYFAHYRLPILKEFATSKDIDFYFCADEQSDNDIKVIDFDAHDFFKGKFLKVKNIFIKLFLWQKGLLSTLNNGNFDAVIFLGEDRFVSTWVAIILMRLKLKKVYLWSHGLYGRESWFRKKIRVFYYSLANGIFLYNDRAKDLLLRENFAADKPIVIYNSLDFEQTEAYRSHHKKEESDKIRSIFPNPRLPVVFCISRINASKKIDLLIEAIAILKKRDVLLNCFIIGDGAQEKAKLEALTAAKGLTDHINFVGGLYEEKEISQYILSSDICICPGAIGLTAIHSLSYGVPVISNDNFAYQGPEFEAIVPGVSGEFFKNGDVADLAAKMEKCMDLRMRDKEKNIQDCLAVIHQYYNPSYQLKVIVDTLKKSLA